MEKKPRGSKRMIAGSLVALVVGATLGVSVERAYANIGTPGWDYGGQYCGCAAGINSTPACDNCCSSTIPLLRTGCFKFCAQAVFPCEPDCPWYLLWLC